MHEVQRVLQILQSEGEGGVPASNHQTTIPPALRLPPPLQLRRPTHLSLTRWSSLAMGFASSRFLARAHSPLPNARASFFANALCSLNLTSSGSCRRYCTSLW